MAEQGNVVLGYCSDDILMLDIDNQTQETTIEFAKNYAEFHDLGKVLVMKTSEIYQLDLFDNIVNCYCIIFGKCPLPWEEIKWHITEARRLGMIERSFTELRKYGYITIRANPKNSSIPYPKIVGYYGEGDNKGVMAYLRHWKNCRGLGRKEDSSESPEGEPEPDEKGLPSVLRTHDDTTDFPKPKTHWITVEERAQRRRKYPTDVYKRDVIRDLEKRIIVGIENWKELQF
jgi:hypothetical protein